MPKKPNPTDSTTRNVKASNRRDALLSARIGKLENQMKEVREILLGLVSAAAEGPSEPTTMEDDLKAQRERIQSLPRYKGLVKRMIAAAKGMKK